MTLLVATFTASILGAAAGAGWMYVRLTDLHHRTITALEARWRGQVASAEAVGFVKGRQVARAENVDDLEVARSLMQQLGEEL